MRVRLVAVLAGAVVLTGGCASIRGGDLSGAPSRVPAAAPAAAPAVTVLSAAAAPATTTPPTTATPPTSATPPTTAAPTTAAPTTPPPTTAPPTTLIPLPANVFDPACARVVQRGDSLSLIADGINDPTVTAESLRSENGIANADQINFGDVLDVCPGNEIDDLTGEQRVAASAESSSGVAAQQAKLNELFAGSGLPTLAVDGVSGPFTRQQLCAARMALHLPISRSDMAPGSQEEQTLMSAQSIGIPADAAVHRSRWVVVSKTCQILFAGEGDSGVRFVFKASTGEPGWETTNQQVVRAFRYDPALHNDGWHNSTKFPVEEDNPLNGNMYRPIYFHRGQAIHGANNVPPEPASKGCVRLRPENQDALIAWLGLDDVQEPTYNSDRIGLSVSVHGDFEPG